MADALRYLLAFARSGFRPFARAALGRPTLADALARWARKRPGALALEVGEHQLSYAELDLVARGAAQLLTRLGARSGDVVALLGRNSLAYVALLLGAARRGVTLALVHPELAGEPLRHALHAADASQVICEADLAGVATDVSAARVTSFDPEARDPFPFEAGAPGADFDAERASRDLALVYTSGTTGLPKACRLPHSRVVAAACLFGAPLYDFRATDKLLCALPLYHGSPLMLGLGACLLSGTPLLLVRRFSASDFIPLARRSAATLLLYVGDLPRMLLATPPSAGDREHRLRLAVGNGMSVEVWSEFQARFGIASVREFYAATESPVGIFNLPGRVGSVGNLPPAWMFGLKLGRVDPDSGELLRDAQGRLQECGPDEPGELLVRARKSGLGVYHGYVDAQHTEERLVRSAFRPGADLFRTGDLLRRDRDGFYYFVERRGESYRFRGENVAVAQVERELRAIAGVADALVSGVALAGYDGRVGLAVLVAEAGFEPARLLALAERLPRSALPRFVRLAPELPRTGSLKLKRRIWADAGVDPGQHSDELWVLLEGRYRQLDSETYGHIVSGRLRL